MTIEWILLFLLIGSFVGFIAGLLGVGGGGILVPVLTYLFTLLEVPMDRVVHLALGTSMSCIVITSFSSMLAQRKQNAIDWSVVKIMSIGVIVGTFLATYLTVFINSLYLAVFFSCFMSFVAFKMLKPSKLTTFKQGINKTTTIFTSIGIGAISALVSIGGGSLTVPYLVSKNMNIKKAIATSAAVGIPISIAGSAGYVLHGWNHDVMLANTIGFVYIPAFILISITSYLTAPVGVKASHKLPTNSLKIIFSILLFLLSIKMLFIFV